MKKGTFYLVMGLPGSGKTTVGTKLYEYLKTKNDHTIILDGDIVRNVFQFQDYSSEGRTNLGQIVNRLIKMLNEQGIDVVGCFVGSSKESRSWCRENIDNFKMIYLKVDMDELIRRDQKQLYSKALRGEIENVLGINAPFEEPEGVDLIVENYGDFSADDSLKKIIEFFDL